MSAEALQIDRAGYYDGILRPIAPSEARSELLRGLPDSLAVRNNRQLKEMPEELPEDLDKFCCFIERYIIDPYNNPRHSSLVERVKCELGKEYNKHSKEELFPVPSFNDDPAVEHVRGCVVLMLGRQIDCAVGRNLHELDLRKGMPEDTFGQDQVVLRVIESGVRSIQSGVPAVGSMAARTLGYPGIPD